MSVNLNIAGSVISLFRYPVKSMMGEEVNFSEVTQRGLLGDRVYALIDSVDGRVGSAKNPRKWPNLFDFRAAYAHAPRTGGKMPRVRITLPDGISVTNDQGDLNGILSKALSREVSLHTTESTHDKGAASAEEYWPDMDHLDHRDTVTDFTMPEGTFFDSSVIHLLTTATLGRLHELYPQGRFEAQRFRPNIIVQSATDKNDFIENDWIGHTLAIGDDVRLAITGPCARCIMTTLAQGDLPKDQGILYTAAKHNKAHARVYATVIKGGTIRRGDPVRIE